MDLAKRFRVVVQDGDHEDQYVGTILRELREVLDKVLRPRPVLNPFRPRLVTESIEPLLKFVQDQGNRLVLEHLLEERARWIGLPHLLELAAVELAFGVPVEQELPKQGVLMVVDGFRDRNEPSFKGEAAEDIRTKPASPFLGPCLHAFRRLDSVVHHCHDVRLTASPIPHQYNRATSASATYRSQGCLDVCRRIGDREDVVSVSLSGTSVVRPAQRDSRPRHLRAQEFISKF
ncbi:hypothetical protein DBT_0423 [Dissulfuribacter thermophilus]|uniref:Uncharacterized protein n=1 Tax=Dissulfuribacter thermophilus TaxID=1156395 RepID=A0A1B9F863_9BACT|nr:hypothetical protein DBT_0423 [Dissulfuribacter thermophilus]